MDIERLAAFSDGSKGGNPAGVVISEALPSDPEMQALAARIGYSETAFAARQGAHWRVRYFAPTLEVPFCGHATIALGAALARRFGDGAFTLMLNDGSITVEGRARGADLFAALQSPPTQSGPCGASLLAEAQQLFRLDPAELDPSLPPALIHAGARHLLLGLRTRGRLSRVDYDFEAGASLMHAHGLTTIDLVHAASPRLFHARNAFAVGGVKEDPATGAAAAALAGYLRDLDWPHGGRIEIHQGDDMGIPCRLTVEIKSQRGAGVRVSGTVRPL